MENHYPQLIDLAVSVITVVLSILLVELKKYLASKTQNSILVSAEDKALNFLSTLIQSQMATTAKGLKQDLEDKKLTRDEFNVRMAELKENTIKATKEAIGTEVNGIIEKNYGDVTTYLKHKLEAFVDELKKK